MKTCTLSTLYHSIEGIDGIRSAAWYRTEEKSKWANTVTISSTNKHKQNKSSRVILECTALDLTTNDSKILNC